MQPLERLRSFIAAWHAWRWKRRVGPVLARIAAVDAEIEIAKCQRRGGIRQLRKRKKALKNRQLKLEMQL
jgi:hypothetical protein